MNIHTSLLQKIQQIVFFIGILVVICLSIVMNLRLGYLNHFESDKFIAFYLGNTPFWEKIFDYRQTDFMWFWRGRDIGNIVNYFDAHIILLSARLGFPHFLSGVYYLVLVSIVSAQLWVAKKFGDTRFYFVSFLLSLVFLTSPPIFLSAIYFRATKPVATLLFVLVSTLLTIAAYTPNPSRRKLITWVISAAILSLCMGLIDETGIALSFFLMSIALIGFFMSKRNSFALICIGILFGPMGAGLYRTVIGPYIIGHIVGITPTAWELAMFDNFTPTTITTTFAELSLYLRSFLGNVPSVATPFLYVILFVLCLVVFRRSPASHGKSMFWPTGWATVTYMSYMGCIFLMLLIMVARNDGVVDMGWLLIYPLLFITAVYVFIHTLLLQISLSKQLTYICTIVTLSALTVGNMLSLNTYITDLTDPKSVVTASYFYRTPSAIFAIKHPEIPFAEINVEIPYAAHAIRTILYPNAE